MMVRTAMVPCAITYTDTPPRSGVISVVAYTDTLVRRGAIEVVAYPQYPTATEGYRRRWHGPFQ